MRINRHVSTVALDIPHHCSSVTVKLQMAKTHLENLLAIKTWASPINMPISPFYATSGQTISTGGSAIPPLPTQTTNLSIDLDGFFENIVSALDIFAHVVNLAYFSPPKKADSVSFDYIISELNNSQIMVNEPLSRHLRAVKKSNWFKEMKPYRRCATHHQPIDYEISYLSSMQPLRGYSPTDVDVKAILLPDNPFVYGQPSYIKRRRVSTLCVRFFRNELNSLDNAFALMQQRINQAQRVPI